MIWPRDEPLTVQYNESNNQKYLTIPSSNTTKAFNEIEEGQKVFPIAVSQDWDKEWYPIGAQLHELLDELEWLLDTIGGLAAKYDQELQEEKDGNEPVEELSWLSEAMTELNHDRISKYKQKLKDKGFVHTSELPEDAWDKNTIKHQHGYDIVQKYHELKENEKEQRQELVDSYPTIQGVTGKGREVEVEFSNDETVRVPLTKETYDEDAPDEIKEVTEFINEFREVVNDREKEFKLWAEEELGYEHRMTENDLGFHQFTFNGFIVEIPMMVEEIGNIQVYEQD